MIELLRDYRRYRGLRFSIWGAIDMAVTCRRVRELLARRGGAARYDDIQ